VQQRLTLTNDRLEATPRLHSLIDGVDATIIDLATEEVDEDELIRLARELTEQTYAYHSADAETAEIMRTVFELRAQRVWAVRQAGRLPWLRETGARARLLDSVEHQLLTARASWDDISSPSDPALVRVMVGWFWQLPGAPNDVREAFRDEQADSARLLTFVESWLAGRTHREIAQAVDLTIDDTIAVHAGLISYRLQTAVEQGIALLRRFCEADNQIISPAVVDFHEYLRFGVPTATSLALARRVRHRRAAVALGQSRELSGARPADSAAVLRQARGLLDQTDRWLPILGRLVLANTKQDLQRFAEPADPYEV
jgi:hypothetical protein